MNVSEQHEAITTLVIFCIVCGPFYLSFLIYGFVRRKKLIVNSLAKWMYIISFPLALALIGAVSFVGDKEINTSSEIGYTLSSLALMSLMAGALAAVYILVKTSSAKHKAARVKGSKLDS